MVMEHFTASIRRRGPDVEAVKLTRLGEGDDDVEAYLTMLEGIMEVNEVSQERWPFQLAPQLTGKARRPTLLLHRRTRDYEKVKTMIL